MFHKVTNVISKPHQQLDVVFAEGVTKRYDMSKLISTHPAFASLKDDKLLSKVSVDAGGYGISWNEEIDLSCDELWANGIAQATPFDNLISFADATELWDLSESTLRKAVAYGKIIDGIDARKYGKQWIVTKQAMEREYGTPKSTTSA